MKKFLFQILSLFVVFIVALVLSYNENFISLFSPNGLRQPVKHGTRLNITDPNTGIVKASLNIEISDTGKERSKGLGGRASLAADSGMLFVYDKKDKYRFWMKNVKFPLDIIWIDGENVADIIQNVPPPEENQKDETLPNYEPRIPVDKVLEVGSGFSGKNNIQVGDKIEVISDK